MLRKLLNVSVGNLLLTSFCLKYWTLNIAGQGNSKCVLSDTGESQDGGQTLSLQTHCVPYFLRAGRDGSGRVSPPERAPFLPHCLRCFRAFWERLQENSLNHLNLVDWKQSTNSIIQLVWLHNLCFFLNSPIEKQLIKVLTHYESSTEHDIRWYGMILW